MRRGLPFLLGTLAIAGVVAAIALPTPRSARIRPETTADEPAAENARPTLAAAPEGATEGVVGARPTEPREREGTQAPTAGSPAPTPGVFVVRTVDEEGAPTGGRTVRLVRGTGAAAVSQTQVTDAAGLARWTDLPDRVKVSVVAEDAG